MLVMIGLALTLVGFLLFVVACLEVVIIIAEGDTGTPATDFSEREESMRDPEHSCCSDRY